MYIAVFRISFRSLYFVFRPSFFRCYHRYLILVITYTYCSYGVSSFFFFSRFTITASLLFNLYSFDWCRLSWFFFAFFFILRLTASSLGDVSVGKWSIFVLTCLFINKSHGVLLVAGCGELYFYRLEACVRHFVEVDVVLFCKSGSTTFHGCCGIVVIIAYSVWIEFAAIWQLKHDCTIFST